MPMLCFWNFITKYVKFKQRKVKETQFWGKKLGKVDFHVIVVIKYAKLKNGKVEETQF